MRGFRGKPWPCALLALFALAVQLVLSFGHIHKRDLLAGWHSGRATLKLARSPAPELPAQPDGHEDFCSICATLALAGSLVLPEQPAIVHPTAPPEPWLGDGVPVIAAPAERLLFQARAPPA
jgi:hypothetical protein